MEVAAKVFLLFALRSSAFYEFNYPKSTVFFLLIFGFSPSNNYFLLFIGFGKDKFMFLNIFGHFKGPIKSMIVSSLFFYLLSAAHFKS